MPGKDFHLSGCVRFQAHPPPALCRRGQDFLLKERLLCPKMRGQCGQQFEVGCQTIMINLGSTPPSGAEAGDFLIFSFLVSNLLLRWDKPS